VSTGAGRAPHRPDARRSTELAGRARCTHGGARGSVVSPCRLPQDELVEGEVRDGLSQPGILQFKLLQPLDLVQLQAAVLLTPPVIGHLGHPDLPHSAGHRRPRTSTSRSLATISSGVCFFLGMFRSSLMPSDILQVGPLQWGGINQTVQVTGVHTLLAAEWNSTML
jgi:hypothetical protein